MLRLNHAQRAQIWKEGYDDFMRGIDISESPCYKYEAEGAYLQGWNDAMKDQEEIDGEKSLGI